LREATSCAVSSGMPSIPIGPTVKWASSALEGAAKPVIPKMANKAVATKTPS
jgi:hypothetical protein